MIDNMKFHTPSVQQGFQAVRLSRRAETGHKMKGFHLKGDKEVPGFPPEVPGQSQGILSPREGE
jgi:hypothetical protein